MTEERVDPNFMKQKLIDDEKKKDEGKRKDINDTVKVRSKIEGMENVRPTVITSQMIRQYLIDYNKEN